MNEDPEADTDDEFEISDLRADQPQRAPRLGSDGGDERGIARRISPRRRRALAGIALALAVVTALALRQYGGSLVPPPTIAPTLRPSAAVTFYIANGASWGALRLNGHAVPTGTLPAYLAPLTLPYGASVLTYTAAPYPTLRCVISAPASPHDTCPLITAYAAHYPIHATTDGRIVDLRATVTNLPAAAFSALEQATDGALASLRATNAQGGSYSATQLAPGDHYLDAQGRTQIATQALNATLQFTLASATPGYSIDCRVFCPIAASPDLMAPITPSWLYTPTGSHTLATRGLYLAPSRANGGSDGQQFLEIAFTWDGAWRVTITSYAVLSVGQGICSDGALALLSFVKNVNFSDIQTLGVGDAQGCAYSIPPPSTLGTPKSTAALYLFRCGVVLAANAAAHMRAPSLPVAAPDEALVAQSVAVLTHSLGV